MSSLTAPFHPPLGLDLFLAVPVYAPASLSHRLASALAIAAMLQLCVNLLINYCSYLIGSTDVKHTELKGTVRGWAALEVFFGI